MGGCEFSVRVDAANEGADDGVERVRLLEIGQMADASIARNARRGSSE